MAQKILVTGGAGYIGSFVVQKLLKKGYRVNVLDSLMYGEDGLRNFINNPGVTLFEGDITKKDDVSRSMNGCSSVIALAAIVGDPACSLDEEYTRNVNFGATKILTEVMLEQRVRRVVFASSCSVYGTSKDIKFLTEDAKLNPVSLYAETRIQSENYLLLLKDVLSPVILRLSTVFGVSARMRFDLAINIMVAKAVKDNNIDIFGGNQWRPFVHVQDVAEAFVLAVEADDARVSGKIFNVGSTDSNYQIEDIADIIKDEMPGVKVNKSTSIVDQRNYNVIFDKIHKSLNFKTEYSVRDGVREVMEFVGANHIDVGDAKYSNFLTVKMKLRSNKFLPFAVPDIGQEEKDEILRTIDSGWLSTGPKTKLFEEKVKEYFQDESLDVIAVSSCTAGLHLQLLAARVGPGDEVITSPMTFCATVNTILYTGAKPVLVDIDPGTYNLNLDLIEKKITNRTKAIVPVYYSGQAVDHKRLREIASAHNLYILADAAHAMGARWSGQLCGSYEDSAAFSFYATKNMTTGEGGIVTTKNKDWAEKIRRLLSHGMDKNAWKRYSEAGSWYYEINDLGFKYNFTDVQAALGLHQLSKIDHFNEIRRQYAALYDEAFADHPMITTQTVKEYAYHTRHLYPVLLGKSNESQVSRARVMEILRQKNIGTSVHYVPIHHHPYYQKTLSLRVDDFPVTNSIYRGILSLPLYTRMRKSDVMMVADALKLAIAD